jgi:DNA polymerase-3 subunit epsilon
MKGIEMMEERTGSAGTMDGSDGSDGSRRRIFLDTETTGLSHRQGHRVIEIGGVEHAPAGRRFHCYLNPDREIDAGALAVHGITRQYLRDKPRFADIAGEFLDFIGGAELVIHNAPFDIGFLNAELALLNRAPIETVCWTITDSLRLARKIHPGEKNSLDALCARYRIDGSKRTRHGALLDAEILAEIYTAMTRRGENPVNERKAPEFPPGAPREASSCS